MWFRRGRLVREVCSIVLAWVWWGIRQVLWLIGDSLLWVLDLIWLGLPARLGALAVHDMAIRAWRGPQGDIWGCWWFVGKKGDGKTISIVEILTRYKALPEHKRPHIISNIECAEGVVDEPLRGWRQLAEAGELAQQLKRPVVVAFDEAGRTFNAQAWEKMPENVIELVTMARKYGVQVLGSVQRFNRIDIQLREQADWIIDCRGWFNFGQGPRLIQQKWYRGSECYLDGIDRPGLPRRDISRRYWFVSTDKLRNAYKTDQILKKLVETPDDELPFRDEMVVDIWKGRIEAREHTRRQPALAGPRGRTGRAG